MAQKKFKDLRDKMSPAARMRAHSRGMRLLAKNCKCKVETNDCPYHGIERVYVVGMGKVERQVELGPGVPRASTTVFDPVERPEHYNSHPSGIECIQVIEEMPYNIGAAIKYLWRAPMKGGVQDLEKAAWHVAREITRLKKKGHP